MSKFTQKAIMLTFLEILKQKSLDKITVKDIIEMAEINRNTFYYYFDDIYDLIDCIFESEKQSVMKEFKEDSTFYEEFVKAASVVINNRQAIIHIYNSKSKDILYHYLEEVTESVVRRFVRKAAEGYKITDDGIEFVTYFYSSAIVGSTIHWVRQGMPDYSEILIRKISESFEVSVESVIQNYVLTDK